MSKARKPSTTDAVEIIHGWFYEGRPARIAELEESRANAEVARTIYELRVALDLTQRELAKRARTTPSVISRLENDDYEGHSLSMLRRIAAALDRRIEIRFAPVRKKKKKRPTRTRRR